MISGARGLGAHRIRTVQVDPPKPRDRSRSCSTPPARSSTHPARADSTEHPAGLAAGPTRRPARPRRKGGRRRDPLWARLMVIFGALLMLTSGVAIFGSKILVAEATKSVTQQNLLGAAGQDRAHVSINGAKNILLVGVDARPDQNPQRPGHGPTRSSSCTSRPRTTGGTWSPSRATRYVHDPGVQQRQGQVPGRPRQDQRGVRVRRSGPDRRRRPVARLRTAGQDHQERLRDHLRRRRDRRLRAASSRS